MLVHFTKMHALGNDFVLIDQINQHVKLHPTLLERLANRHFGIGCDQILSLEPPKNPDADFHFRFFNANGQEAEQCGNGARALARYALDAKLICKKNIIADCLAGRLTLKVCEDDEISVDLGQPNPLVPETQSLEIENQSLFLHTLSFGNPHCILEVDDLEKIQVAKTGKLISTHPLFPAQTNVGFLQIIHVNHAKLRIYERGVGPTHSCGSAAVAAAAVGFSKKKLEGQVNIEFEHGSVFVSKEKDDHFWLKGPATRLYTGRFRL